MRWRLVYLEGDQKGTTKHSDVARTVNSAQVLLYWDLGNRIHQEILKGRRAEYGLQILQTLSAQLEREFGRGFAPRNMHRMMQFCQSFPDRQKVSTLSTQLSWSHFVELLPLGDRLKYAFYTEMCRI